MLEASESEPLWISERDGRCLFDQLQAPESIRPYLGRPPLRVSDIVDSGLLSLLEVRRLAPACKHLASTAGYTLDHGFGLWAFLGVRVLPSTQRRPSADRQFSPKIFNFPVLCQHRKRK